MPRSIRLVRAEQPLHIIQRGNNRSTSFNDADDVLRYKSALREAAERAGCAIHAYVFMSNHVHLLVTPETIRSASTMMQMVGRRYVRYFNDRYSRTGTLWEGRFRSMLIDSEKYFFTCSRYIELNPVRAGIVTHAEAYPWSSLRHAVVGEPDRLLTSHALFDALGRTDTERRAAYRAMFDQHLDDAAVDAIRRATNSGSSVLSAQHRRELAQRARRVAEVRRLADARAGQRDFAWFEANPATAAAIA